MAKSDPKSRALYNHAGEIDAEIDIFQAEGEKRQRIRIRLRCPKCSEVVSYEFFSEVT